MTAESGNRSYMQNPGDLRVPEGVEITPSARTLVLNGKAELVDPNDFDIIVELYPKGSGKPSLEEEQLVVEETTLTNL